MYSLFAAQPLIHREIKTDTRYSPTCPLFGTCYDLSDLKKTVQSLVVELETACSKESPKKSDDASGDLFEHVCVILPSYCAGKNPSQGSQLWSALTVHHMSSILFGTPAIPRPVDCIGSADVYDEISSVVRYFLLCTNPSQLYRNSI